MSVRKVKMLVEAGKFKQALDIIDKLTDREKKFGLIFKSIILKDMGKFKESIAISEKVLKNTNNVLIKIGSYMSMGYAKWKSGELNNALEVLENGLGLISELSNQEIKELHELNWQSTILNIQGLIYWQLGQLTKAMNCHKSSYLLRKEYGTSFDTAASLNNIALIYRDRGEFKKALEYFYQSLELLTTLDNRYYQGIALANIGIIYHDQGQLQKAIEYLLQSLELKENTDNPIEVAESLFWLVKCHIGKGNIEEASVYLEYLKKLLEERENKRIKIMMKLAEALIFRQKSRIKYKYKALQNLNYIVEKEELVEHKYTVIAIIQLCKLLIEEMSMLGPEEIIHELKSYVNQLEEIAEKQNSKFLICETLLLKAKVELLDLNFLDARRHLLRAEVVAKNQDLKPLRFKISEEYDDLLTQITNLREMIDRDISLEKRIDLIKLKSHLNQFMRSHDTEPIGEEPIMIMIITKSGVDAFSYLFSEAFYKEHLMAGVISAINTLMKEVFDSDGSIDRIRFLNYTILLKPIADYLICYVFRGPSYFAKQKVDSFSKIISQNEEKWLGSRKMIHSLTSSEEEFLKQTVNEVFDIKKTED